ncbi:thiol-disulfide oxidoreductase DCC family protein [Neobacillus sp. LXY-1]|uniref:thiol-disulfide oxidoreductase DCC family protein n=1 Tax=Neobacillus sp. LXY-1 TaxID=3379133 RepID=UPI003EE22D02
MKQIILFDGVCNLCNSSVQFIIKRDPKGHFQFASIQGKMGQNLLKKYHVNTDINSFILIDHDKVFFKSNAALRVCRNLAGYWKWLAIFFIIPSTIRNGIYDFIANNRYKWFGKKESCMIPSQKWKNRFLD